MERLFSGLWGNLKKMSGFCVAYSLIFTAVIHAKTFYVSTTGNDANPGTSGNPIASVIKAIGLAQPGDSIRVKPGLYRGRYVINKSGQSGSKIVLQGEPGVILDGGDIVKGWQAAPEVAAGVYKKPVSEIGYEPYSMTWNNKAFMKFTRDKAGDLGIPRIAESLGRPVGDEGWEGIEALFSVYNSICYIGFKDGKTPEGRDLTASPEAAVLKLDGVSHVLINGFTLRNAAYGIHLTNGGSDNVIQDNVIWAGNAGIYTTAAGSRNRIVRNQITMNYIYADYGLQGCESSSDPAAVDQYFVHRRIFGLMKNASLNNRWGIYMESLNSPVFYKTVNRRVFQNVYQLNQATADPVGVDNEIAENRIHGVMNAMGQFCNAGHRLKVHHNIFEQIAFDAFQMGSPNSDSIQYHDNVCINVTSLVRLKSPAPGPIFIYRNRVVSTWEDRDYPTSEWTIDMGWDTDAKIFIYHNSLSSGGRAINSGCELNGWPNVVFVNNVLSCMAFAWGESQCSPPAIKSVIDYNWVGGWDYGLLGENSPGWGTHNAVATDQRVWTPASTKPEDMVVSNARFPVGEMGIDLSKPFTISGRTFYALPGMKPGYFPGKAPDLGAIQSNEDPNTGNNAKPKTEILPNGIASVLPFAGGVRIQYSATQGMGQIRLGIYDLQGKCVRKFSGVGSVAGKRTLLWNGRSEDGLKVSQGMYFFRLSTGKQVYNRQIMVVR